MVCLVERPASAPLIHFLKGAHMQQIIIKDTNDLKPSSRNARTHSDKQINQIGASIRQFGFNNPILIDNDNSIIAGHGRWQAARKLGVHEVPTICLAHLSPDEIRAYMLADNKLAEKAGWDADILAIEFQHLSSLDLGFELEITGFETGEIDFLIGDSLSDQLDPADEVIESDPNQPVRSRLGDLWALGKHRLYCGNSLATGSYEALMGKERAQMVFTDPPYNVPIDGHVCGTGSIQHREFAMASGEMSSDEFINFLGRSMAMMTACVQSGAIMFYCMDWRHMQEILSAGQKTGLELKNLCIWVKDNGGMGSLYRSRHELVFVFKHGNTPHINNVELGKHGRYRTNVWEYAGVNSLKKDRMEELAMHPTVKPAQMVADAIMDCSKHNGIILDPFGGSGTTLIAAEKTGRQARLIEFDLHYCDVILSRWEKLTGQQAELIGGQHG
jgi:DNA modification methylase